ncbi:hypothetical protein NE848_17230 [Gramella jeungdoensis]|uniref:Uncharacterized protein n=2 Tax=Gramella jeungdoensis TaxID=708091 RepID=A0ABT0Z5Y5_9FLAO|nr:hypothetical protein [Gramella jeungdoensis]
MLYLLNDMVEEQLESTKKELDNCSKSDIEKIKVLKLKILWFEAQLEKFKDDIDKQLKEKFQFSIEELYSMYGQYEEKYINIEFHKFSDSAKKFGRKISGFIEYTKEERENLEQELSKKEVSRTNGKVKFKCTSCDDLSEETRKELRETGFLSGDIYEVLASNFPAKKSFGQTGRKEIPNTIEVEFDPSGMDPYKAQLSLFNQRLKDGGKLIDSEIEKLCGFSLYYKPEANKLDIIKNNAFDQDGNKIENVRFQELRVKIFNEDFTQEEVLEFSELLTQRKSNRIELIQAEIKRSTNKKLEKFEQEYPEIYGELLNSTLHFEDEALVYYDSVKPIYWDYRSYLHIYLRHCEELEIEGHFEQKTNFQYSPKDIRRTLKIAIERLIDPINERLAENKEFRVYGNKALYFNGNHYSLHILNDGRVAAFHPLENPEE